MEKDTEDLYKQLNDIVNSIYTIKHKKINFVLGFLIFQLMEECLMRKKC